MGRYAAARLLSLLPVLVGASLVVFILVKLVPGDPVSALLGPEAPQRDVDNLRQSLGLNEPVAVQYALWLRRALGGDLGMSIQKRLPVTALLFSRLRNTLLLTGAALVFAVSSGLTLGVLSATRTRSVYDRAIMVIALFGNSMPVFWLGILLILVFSVYLGWLPSGGLFSPRDGPSLSELMRHLILPASALGLTSIGGLVRLTRSAMLDVINEDYVRTARAKGLPERSVIWWHSLRNAALPIVTLIGAECGILLGGAVLTETVFGWTGIGLLIYEAIAARDLPVVLGGVLVIVLAFTLINLVTDLLYGYLDPRVRYT